MYKPLRLILLVALIAGRYLVSLAGSESKLSDLFIENRGQVKTEKGQQAGNVLFYKPGPMELFVTTTGYSVIVKQHEKSRCVYNKIDFEFEGAQIKKSQVIYVSGNGPVINSYGPGGNIKGIAAHRQVIIKNIYPGIDWVWAIDKNGIASHDFMVNEGADASLIKYTVQGADIDNSAGNLLKYKHQAFSMREGPVVFQFNKKDLQGNVLVKGKTVSFALTGEMKNGGFTIDPPLQLTWTAGLDSSGNTGFRDITADAALNTFSVGYSDNFTLPVFPQVYGSYTSEDPEAIDAVIMKTDYSQNLVWCTFFGGSGNDEANAITATPAGIFVAGYSESWDFPIAPVTGGTNGYDNLVALHGRDAFIAKFSNQGELQWSTGYGGSNTDEALSIKYYNGLIFVGGYTWSGDFPAQRKAGAYFYQDTNLTSADGFLLEFDTLANRKWATCFGGSGNDYISSVFADSTGIYFTGYSDTIGALQIPLVQPGSAYYQTSHQNTESFIGNFSLPGVLQWSSYFGGPGNDVSSCVVRNRWGLFICGKTDAAGLPVLSQNNNNYFQNTFGGGATDGFITRFDPVNWQMHYCSYYGTTGTDALTHLATDANGNTIYTGFTNGTLPAIIQSPYFFQQNGTHGGFDGLMFGLDSSQIPFWSTCFGGPGNDFGYGVQFTIPYVVDMVGQTFYNFGQDTIGGTYNSDTCPQGGLFCPFVTTNGESNRFYNIDNFNGSGGGYPIGANGCAFPLFYQKLIPLKDPCPNQCNGVANVDTTNMYGCQPYTVLWSDGGTALFDTTLCETYWNQVTDNAGQIRVLYSRFDVLRVPKILQVNSDCKNVPDWNSIITPEGGEPPYNINFRGIDNATSCPTTAYFAITDSVGCVVSTSFPWYQNNVNLMPSLSVNGQCALVSDLNAGTENCLNLQNAANWKYIIKTGTDSIISPFQPSGYTQAVAYPTGSGYYTGYLNLGDCQIPLQPAFFYQKPIDTITRVPDCANNNGSITLNITPDPVALHYLGYDTVYITVFDSSTNTAVPGFTQQMVVFNSGLAQSITISNLSGDSYLVSVYNNSCDSTVRHVNLSSVNFTLNTPYINCGDTVPLIATVNAGIAPYTYNWSNAGSFTDSLGVSSPGAYSLTVYDGSGCSASASTNVYGTGALLINAVTPLNTECPYTNNASAAAAVVAGGAPPYIYNWSTGETTDTAVNIVPNALNTITVTDINNCSATAAYLDTIPPQLAAYDMVTNPLCTGPNYFGTMNLFISNGFQFVNEVPYTIVWSVDGNVITPFTTVNSVPGFYNVAASLAGGSTYQYSVTDAYGCNVTGSDTVISANPITFKLDTFSVTCHGQYNGGFNLTNLENATFPYHVWVYDNTYPYFYSHYPGTDSSLTVSNLPSGYFNFTLNDANGCEADTEFSVNQPPALFVALDTGKGIVCTGGVATIRISATGGTPPYNDTGTFQLPAGTYTYYVSDMNGCDSNLVFTLTDPLPFSDSLWIVQPACTNNYESEVGVSAKGGSLPYSITVDSLFMQYFTDTGAVFNCPPGTLPVSVTDNRGCTLSSFATIDSSLPLQGSITVYDPSCNGLTSGSVSLFISSGQAPFSYSGGSLALGENDITGLSAGTYNFVVYDALNCADTFTAVLSTASPVVATDSVLVPIYCYGNTATVDIEASGGVPPYSGTGASQYGQGQQQVTVYDNNGCPGNISFNILSPTQLSVNYNIDQMPLCGNDTGLVTFTPGGGTPPYQLTINTLIYVITGPVQLVLGPGNYTFQLQDSFDCVQQNSFNLNTSTALNASLTSSNPLCNGDNSGVVNISVSSGTPPYSVNGNQYNNGGITLQGLTAGTYGFNITDNAGCSTGLSAVLTDPPPINVSYTIVQNAGCAGQPAIADIEATGGTPPYTGTGSNQFGQGQQQATVYDNNGCSAVVNFNIPAPPLLSVTYNIDQQPACGNDTGLVTFTPVGGAPPYQLSVNSLTYTISTPVQLILGPGSYNFQLQDASGCSQQGSFNLNTSTALNASLTSSNPLCTGDNSGVINISVSSGTPPYSVNGNQYNNSSITLPGYSSGSYSFTISDNAGCSTGLNASLSDPPPLSAGYTIVQNIICNGQMATVDIEATGGTAPYLNTGAQTFNGGPQSVTVTDTNQCSVQVNFTVANPPAMLVSSEVLILPECGSGYGEAEISASGGQVPYSMQIPGGSPVSFSNNIVLSLQAGEYVLQVTDNLGCTQNVSFAMDPANPLSATLAATNPACYGGNTGSVVISVNSGYPPFNVSNTNYPGYIIPINNLSAGNDSLILTDSLGCSVSLFASLSQPPALAIDTSLLTSGLTCQGLNNAVVNVNASGGTPQYTYSLESDSVPTVTQAGNSFNAVAPGAYTVLVTDALGCVDSLPLVVPVFIPSHDSVVVDSVTCYGTNTGVIKIYPVPGYRNPYTYSLDGGAAQVYNVFYNLPANVYQVIVSDVNNCKDTLNVSIGQPDSIDGRVWLNGNLLPLDTIVLTSRDYANFSKLSANPWSVTFSPGTTYISYTDSLVQVQPRETLTYTVTIYMDSADMNCFIQYTGLINVVDIPELPNTITPNGDGFNDVWKIDLIKFPNPIITIFDRWGEVVYSSSDYNNDWGGIDQKSGKKLPDGTYFYLLKVPSQNNAEYKGDINIVDASR